jgi:hypothetical protein
LTDRDDRADEEGRAPAPVGTSDGFSSGMLAALPIIEPSQ